MAMPMSLETLVIFLGVTTVTSIMPGPNAMMTMAQGIAHGARGAFWTIIGSVLCLAGMMVVSAAGAGAILMASETAFQVVKWAGVAYMVFLGVQAWRAPPQVLQPDGTAAGGEGRSAPIRLQVVKGFACSASNPKAMLFWGALFPQFLDPAQSVLVQTAILGAVAFIVEFIVMMGYGLGAAGINRALARKGNTTLFNKISGGTMLGAAALMATVRR